MPTFSQGFSPASSQMVFNFEERNSIELPADYAQFLRTTNGGVPVPNCFCVPGRGEALVDFLYGLRGRSEPCDLGWEQDRVNDFNQLPPGLIVIGHDPGGNSLLLRTGGPDAGQVAYWDSAGFWEQDRGVNVYPVATSFAEFLDSLADIPDAE